MLIVGDRRVGMTPLNSRTAACLLWLSVTLACALATAGPQKANHELLTNLGLVRRRVAPAHHRKRLAAEVRSSTGAGHDDSHMVVIKLPPAPYYYAHAKPTVTKNAEPPLGTGANANAVNKVPLHFHGNGKPTGVYHWNLPVLKKMKTSHGRHGGATKRTSDADSKIYHIQKTSPYSEHAQHILHNTQHYQRTEHAHSNDVLKGKESEDSLKAQIAKSKISFYTPRRKTMFHKYFQGNGKPHSFYVIEKSKKPIHYHRLLPGTR